MTIINGIEMDDGVDEPGDGIVDWDEDSFLGEEGCLFPQRCCMPGIHYTSECHTAEDMERWVSESQKRRAFARRMKRQWRHARRINEVNHTTEGTK